MIEHRIIVDNKLVAEVVQVVQLRDGYFLVSGPCEIGAEDYAQVVGCHKIDLAIVGDFR